jgi:large subunit ribosomal protein L3
MGHDQVTVKNLVVSYIDVTNNIIGLRGAVPGPKKGLIVIDSTTRLANDNTGGKA